MNVEGGEPIATLLKHEDGVGYAEFSSDAQRVATASSDNIAIIWNIANLIK